MAGLSVDHQGLDASGLLRQSGLDKLQTSFMRIYGWWWSFSVNLAGIMGVIFVLAAIKAIGNIVLNATFLYKTFGCGFRLLTMFWGTLAKYLLIPSPTHAADTSSPAASAPQDVSYDPLLRVDSTGLYPPVTVQPGTSQYPNPTYRLEGTAPPIV